MTAPKKRLPSRGRIVTYVSAGSATPTGPEGTLWGATVVEVQGDPSPESALILCVFTPAGPITIKDVPHFDDKTPGSWDWPDPVPYDDADVVVEQDAPQKKRAK